MQLYASLLCNPDAKRDVDVHFCTDLRDALYLHEKENPVAERGRETQSAVREENVCVRHDHHRPMTMADLQEGNSEKVWTEKSQNKFVQNLF